MSLLHNTLKKPRVKKPKEKAVQSEFNKDRIGTDGRFTPNSDDLKEMAELKEKFIKESGKKKKTLLHWQQPWL